MRKMALKLNSIVFILLFSMLTGIVTLNAQKRAHPRIYTTNTAKAEFLNSIKTIEWKKAS